MKMLQTLFLWIISLDSGMLTALLIAAAIKSYCSYMTIPFDSLNQTAFVISVLLLMTQSTSTVYWEATHDIHFPFRVGVILTVVALALGTYALLPFSRFARFWKRVNEANNQVGDVS